MKVLIACEESQVVCQAFRNLGHEAYSCDIQDCSGGHPEWHIKDDAIKILYTESWDLVIAHPPCTYLANSGVQHLHKDKNRWELLKEARILFMEFYNYPGKIAIENPIPHKYSNLPMYSQIIQPYQFGHTEQKSTCLWLKNVPPLLHTSDNFYYTKKLPKNIAQRLHYLPKSKDRAKIRSKTFPGIAEAMAKQWGGFASGKELSLQTTNGI